MDSLPAGQPIIVGPMEDVPVIKDLVTDVSWNYTVNKKIPPFQPKAGTDWKFSQADADRVQNLQVHRVFLVSERLPRLARSR